MPGSAQVPSTPNLHAEGENCQTEKSPRTADRKIADTIAATTVVLAGVLLFLSGVRPEPYFLFLGMGAGIAISFGVRALLASPLRVIAVGLHRLVVALAIGTAGLFALYGLIRLLG